jgi:hypothetical protein
LGDEPRIKGRHNRRKQRQRRDHGRQGLAGAVGSQTRPESIVRVLWVGDFERSIVIHAPNPERAGVCRALL